MSRTYTKQELTERYEKLPDALKDAMFSADVAEKIFAAGKKHGLTIEKIGFLAEETGRVILGVTRPNEFVAVLAERLGATPDAAQNIASDINHQIFFPLREILKTTHQVDIGEAAIQRPADAIDLRAMARPPPRPSPVPSAPPVSQKVPPIDLRVKSMEETQRPPLVDIGDITIPPPGPAHFLTREETEKVVAEKRIAPRTLPPPPSKPPRPQPLGDMVSNLETDTPSIPPVESKTSPANPQVFPQPVKPFSPAIPPSSPQVVPSVPQSKIPPIDLRKDKEISLDFMPPPPIPPRSAPPASAAPPPLVPPHILPPAPVSKLETPSSRPVAPAPPSSPAPPKNPPIDLRKVAIKTKPWSGTDPYKEPIE